MYADSSVHGVNVGWEGCFVGGESLFSWLEIALIPIRALYSVPMLDKTSLKTKMCKYATELGKDS